MSTVFCKQNISTVIGSNVAATAGSVLFAGASGILAQDNANLFWDDANNELGIGTATPAYKLAVSTNTAADGIAVVNSLNSGYLSMINGAVAAAVCYPQIRGKPVGDYGFKFRGIQSDTAATDTATFALQATNAAQNGTVAAGQIAIEMQNWATSLMAIMGDGKVGIGTITPKSRLDVEGNASIGATYSGTTAAPTNGLIVEGTVGIGTTTPGDLLTVGPYETPTFTANQDKTIGLYGAGAAYFRGRDTTNDVEFIMGTSVSGYAFVASITDHPLVFRINNGTEVMRLTTAGAVETLGGLTTVGALLTMSTKELTVVAGDVLGRINFKASLESSTGDSRLVGASIVAVAEDTFTTTVNKTSLLFETGASEEATTKMAILSSGNVGIGSTAPDRQLEINTGAATGGLRLTYNDANGSAAVYADLLVDSAGDFTITPTGGDIIAGSANIGTTGAVKGVHKAADGTAAVADGTYTTGIGGTTNGTITIKDGIITAIQQAVA